MHGTVEIPPEVLEGMARVPARTVQVPAGPVEVPAFLLGETPVTHREYAVFLGACGERRPSLGPAPAPGRRASTLRSWASPSPPQVATGPGVAVDCPSPRSGSRPRWPGPLGVPVGLGPPATGLPLSLPQALRHRTDALKATHARWMGELFAGEYGEDYFNNRLRIGMAHVRIGLDPHWVEAVMSFLRAEAVDAIAQEFDDDAQRCDLYKSLCKLLDLDMMLINVAYGEERLDRITSFTGLSRKLLERCISKG